VKRGESLDHALAEQRSTTGEEAAV